MGLLTTARSVLGRESDDGPHRYECMNCGERFESARTDKSEARCPACDSGRLADR